MCSKAVNNHPHALEFVPECYKTLKMYDKAVNTHPPTIQFVPKCYKQFIYVFFVFDSIPDQNITQEKNDIVVSLYPFLIVYCVDKYVTQRMCDEAVDDSLAALKLIPN